MYSNSGEKPLRSSQPDAPGHKNLRVWVHISFHRRWEPHVSSWTRACWKKNQQKNCGFRHLMGVQLEKTNKFLNSFPKAPLPAVGDVEQKNAPRSLLSLASLVREPKPSTPKTQKPNSSLATFGNLKRIEVYLSAALGWIFFFSCNFL